MTKEQALEILKNPAGHSLDKVKLAMKIVISNSITR